MDETNNVIIVTLWVQFWLTGVILIGIWILKGGPQRLVRINPHNEALSFNIVTLPFRMGICGFAASLPLFFSEGFSASLQKFTSTGVPNIADTYAIILTLLVDVFLVGYMVRLTGGGQISPFVGLFFVLPTIALFLKMPFNLIVIYAVMTVVVYLILLPKRFFADGRDHEKALKIASVVIRITCLMLTMSVAYFRLPQNFK